MFVTQKFVPPRTQHPLFDVLVTSAIFANALAMSLPYYGASADYTAVLEGINLTCGVLFILEAALKITAFRGAYFHGGWEGGGGCEGALESVR